MASPLLAFYDLSHIIRVHDRERKRERERLPKTSKHLKIVRARIECGSIERELRAGAESLTENYVTKVITTSKHLI